MLLLHKTEDVEMLIKMSANTLELSKTERFDFAQTRCSVRDRLICRN